VDILKKLSDGAKSSVEAAKKVGRKSSDLVESTKIKFEISKLEKEVENNISALGYLTFVKFKGEEGHDEEIERLINSTKSLEDEVAELEEQVEKLHPKPPVCPICTTEYPPGAKFCMNCGAKIEKEAPAE
jgi:hypothetical protein